MNKTTGTKAERRGGARPAMVSVATFARARGVSETAIRKRIKSGVLLPAMAGNKINVVKANRILDDGTTQGEHINSELVAARKRKLIAKCSSLRTEVKAIGSNVVWRSIADKVIQAEQARICEAIMHIPDDLAFDDDLAGMDANSIFKLIDHKVRDVLTALAGRDAAEPSPEDEPDQLPDLAELTPSGLVTLINNLQADRIEIDALLASGEAVRVDDVGARFNDKLLRVRGRLLAVAGRVASVEASSKLKAKLKAALSEALEELAKEPEPDIDEDAA